MFKKAVPKPDNIHLGEGVLIFNFNPNDWEDPASIKFGATRGGGSFNIEGTNRSSRFDGDRGEDFKGLKSRSEWKINIIANALELDHEKFDRYMPSTVTDVATTMLPPTPDYRTIRPNVDFADTDYYDNLAYVTQTKSGKVVAYVIENVLADGNFSAAMNDKDDVVSEVTFTAHFDESDVLPAYIVHYDVA